AGRDHGADLLRPARRDRGAPLPGVRRARDGAHRPQGRDRAPLLGGRALRSRGLGRRIRSMKAAVYRGGGRLVAEDWPRPSIGAGELLLRLKGCGLCGSDIAKIVDPATRIPAVFGHEVVGEVAAVGAGVTSYV